MNYYYFLILIILNIILFHSVSYFCLKFGIVDKPNNQLKKHKNVVPYSGGVVFYLNFVLIFTYFYYFNNLPFNNDLALFFVIYTFIFLIGFFDDIFDSSPILRFLFLIIIIFFFIKNFNIFNLEIIRFKHFDYTFYLNSAGILFTIFCLLVFIQACNMIDGINLQFGIYNLALILYLNSFFINFTIFFIPIFVVFLYFNYRNKAFLGDGGSYFISFLIGSVFIFYYNQTNFIMSDDIFIAMLIPGLEMTRLFFSRINIKKSPFVGDRNHLHHLFIEKYGEKNAIILSPIVIIAPIILKMFIDYNPLIILLGIMIYTLILIFLKSSK